MRALVWKKENHKIWHWIPYENYYHMILILLIELIELKDFQWKHGAKKIIFCFCSCLSYINVTETFFVMYEYWRWNLWLSSHSNSRPPKFARSGADTYLASKRYWRVKNIGHILKLCFVILFSRYFVAVLLVFILR